MAKKSKDLVGSKAVGRSPIQRLYLRFNNINFLLLGIYPTTISKRPTSYRMQLVDSRGSKKATDIADTPTAAPTEEKAAFDATQTETSQNAPNTALEFPAEIVVRQGKEPIQVHPVSPKQLDAFNKYITNLRGEPGISVLKIVPASTLGGIVPVNTYYLDPANDLDMPTRYRMILEYLRNQDRRIFGTLTMAKIYAYVLIEALPRGLIMHQLPFEEDAHRIEDAISPEWQAADVNQNYRGDLADFLDTLTVRGLPAGAIKDPVENYLQKMVEGNVRAGIKPKPGYSFMTISDALEALKTGSLERGTPSSKNASGKNKRKEVSKKAAKPENGSGTKK